MPLIAQFGPMEWFGDLPDLPTISVIFVVGTIGGLAVVRYLAQVLQRVQPLIVRLAAPESGDPAEPFRAVRSTYGPLALSLASSLVFVAPPVLATPDVGGVVVLLVNFVAGIPMWTLMWVGGSVLVGVDRLGRMPLRLVSFDEDRSLGLRPFGRLAFVSLLPLLSMSLIWTVANVDNLRDFLISVTISLVILGLFLLSLNRLHQQMVRAKTERLTQIRGQISTILRDAPAQEAEQLSALVSRLQLAESLERRAQSIQEWPFDEGIQRFLVAITSGVIVTTLARLVISRFGL